MISRKTVKRIVGPILQKIEKRQSQKIRRHQYKGAKFQVLPGVFHPGLFFSSELLTDFALELPIKGKSTLELGCGAGMLSTILSINGAEAFASDINPIAIDNCLLNAKENKVKVTAFHSNLFEVIPQDYFDYIFINPPYYPKQPANDTEKAWYCGTNFQYFHTLFSQLAPLNYGKTYMILSEDCDIEHIKTIAIHNKLELQVSLEKKILMENNIIFEIKKV